MLTAKEKYLRRTMRRHRAYEIRLGRRRSIEPRECVALPAKAQPVDMTFIDDGRYVQKARARQDAVTNPMGGFFWAMIVAGFKKMGVRMPGKPA